MKAAQFKVHFEKFQGHNKLASGHRCPLRLGKCAHSERQHAILSPTEML